MDLSQSVAEVVIPLQEYNQYRQLRREGEQLRRQREEYGWLIVRLQEKEQAMLAQLTKKHEEGRQLAQTVKQLSRSSLKSMREAVSREKAHLHGLEIKEEEIKLLCEERERLQKQVREAEKEAIEFLTQNERLVEEAEERKAVIAIYEQREEEWQQAAAELAGLRRRAEELERQRDEIQEAVLSKEQEMQKSMQRVMHMVAYSESGHDLSHSEVLECDQSSLIKLGSLSSTDPQNWEQIYSGISSIRSDSSRFRVENSKLDLKCKRLQEELDSVKLALAEKDSLHLSAVARLEEALRASEAKVDDLTREVSLVSHELKKNASSRETKGASDSYKSSGGPNSSFELDSSILTEKNSELLSSVYKLKEENEELRLKEQNYKIKYLDVSNKLKKLKEKQKQKQKDKQKQEENGSAPGLGP